MSWRSLLKVPPFLLRAINSLNLNIHECFCFFFIYTCGKLVVPVTGRNSHRKNPSCVCVYFSNGYCARLRPRGLLNGFLKTMWFS